MNVIFHTTVAIAIVVTLTDTTKVKSTTSLKMKLLMCLSVFMIGLISHGILDYIPHCYPLPSKMDVVLSITLMMISFILTNGDYKFILVSAFIGCIFPDIIDLSPSILNKYLGTHFQLLEKVFPWHWKEYSGSIYGQKPGVSWLNHAIVIICVLAVVWFRRTDTKIIFSETINPWFLPYKKR